VAEQVFTRRSNEFCPVKRERMQSLEKQVRLTLSCLYSAYKYRNKFVHQGLPFPQTVTQIFDRNEDSGMNYLNPVEGISFEKRYSPGPASAQFSQGRRFITRTTAFPVLMLIPRAPTLY